jgi:N-methylhydantoinase A
LTDGWFIGVDIGGTFTDIVAVDAGGGSAHHLKVPSNRIDPAAGVIEGLAALQEEIGDEVADVRLLAHGTTIVTNAIIERRLARTALVTTAGFGDVLEIGRHWRTELYDPFLRQPKPLLAGELRFEVRERVDPRGVEIEPLNQGECDRLVSELTSADVKAIAVVFLHSYSNPRHEEQVEDRLRSANGWFVCRSSSLSREVREYERMSTTVLNAALMPLVDEYMNKLELTVRHAGDHASLFVTQSNGGALTPATARSRPVALALSGPAAGVMACVELGRQLGRGDLIGFDMGGTSTDISIISGYQPRFATQLTIGDLPIRLPTVEMESIGAGGGSIASLDAGGSLRVGPESAGSDPGPACYGRGGTEPTITDCQLSLGRLSNDFPLAGRLGLDVEAARAAVDRVGSALGLDVETAAAGVVEIANAAMERAVRVALRKRGDDPREFALVAFGGAGPLHAAELARRLAISTVIVPPHPGTLSALGLLTADVRLDFAASTIHRSDEEGLADVVGAAFAALERDATAQLEHEGHVEQRDIRFERSCDIRYLGQAYEVNVPASSGSVAGDGAVAEFLERFHELHQRAYGFASPADLCELVTFRVAATVAIEKPSMESSARNEAPGERRDRLVQMPGLGPTSTAVYDRKLLAAGTRIAGPAVVHQPDATTLVPHFAVAVVDAHDNLVLSIADDANDR